MKKLIPVEFDALVPGSHFYDPSNTDFEMLKTDGVYGANAVRLLDGATYHYGKFTQVVVGEGAGNWSFNSLDPKFKV